MGDAAGIGPEIIVKALAGPAVYRIARPMVIGDRARLARYAGDEAGPVHQRARVGLVHEVAVAAVEDQTHVINER